MLNRQPCLGHILGDAADALDLTACVIEREVRVSDPPEGLVAGSLDTELMYDRFTPSCLFNMRQSDVTILRHDR